MAGSYIVKNQIITKIQDMDDFQTNPEKWLRDDARDWRKIGVETNPNVNNIFDEDKPRKFLTITEITEKIKGKLETGFSGVWVAGEVSNVRKPGSGHIYLTLKDANAQLQAVIFKYAGNRIKFDLKDGLEVIVYGSITVYEPRGQYQIKVETIEPRGVGVLQLAFQQLKLKLEKEGLFNAEHKKPLPFLPQKIGIVTSPTGAAINDMVNIINRRCPGVQILLYPVKVQGDGAAEEIAHAIAELNKLEGIDVMIVGRGGGSIEDLWAFNEEVVARSIYNSKVPVISAVGHETDITISDFVADKRALTPSEAGEMAVPRRDLLLDTLNNFRDRLVSVLRNRVVLTKNRLQMLANNLSFRKPLDKVHSLQQKIDDLMQKFSVCIRHTLEMKKEKLSNIGNKLESLSPLSILNRGYSLTTKLDDLKSLKDIDALKKGDLIRTKLYKGSVVSIVDSID